MLNQKLAEAMQRILSKDEERFKLTKTLEALIETGIGTKRGGSAYFTAKDKEEIRSWLQAKGFAVEQVNLSGMTRSECLALSPNEKAGGETVKRNRVSIKALAGQSLVIGGEAINLPAETHLDADWKKIADALGHRCILLVENYENFNRIHETTFKLPVEYRSPLVVYRGDPHESRFDHVLRFLAQAELPVLAFMDADPAGVAIASLLPNLVGMVLPQPDVLQEQLRNPQTARKDLFLDQYTIYSQTLDSLGSEHPCHPVWNLISKCAAGVVQERWIQEAVKIFA